MWHPDFSEMKAEVVIVALLRFLLKEPTSGPTAGKWFVHTVAYMYVYNSRELHLKLCWRVSHLLWSCLGLMLGLLALVAQNAMRIRIHVCSASCDMSHVHSVFG